MILFWLFFFVIQVNKFLNLQWIMICINYLNKIFCLFGILKPFFTSFYINISSFVKQNKEEVKETPKRNVVRCWQSCD